MKKSVLRKIPIVALASIIAFFFLLPLMWMFFTSFKPLSEAMSSAAILPETWTLENYQSIIGDESAPMFRWLFNTFFITTVGTALVVIVDVLAAYSLARLDVPAKKFVMPLIFFALAVPGIVTLFPAFYMFKEAGLIDTFFPLILPYTASVMGVFLIYNFLKAFPKELEEAAYIDGASQFQILRNVIFPTIKPVVATLAVFTFLAIYNDYLWPSLVTSTDEMKTITLGLANLTQGANFVNPAKMMASTVIATLPALIVFLITNKYIVKGVTNSGLK